MAAGGVQLKFRSPDEEVEYNDKLSKAIQTLFVNSMPAVQLLDRLEISGKLTREEMQKVTKKNDNEGVFSAARLLLEILTTKHDWFSALMKALDYEELRLQEFKKKFSEIKDDVDRQWMKTRGTGPHLKLGNPSASWEPKSPTQSEEEAARKGQMRMELDTVADSGGDGGIVNDDFTMTTSAGLQRDTVLEEEDMDIPAEDATQPFDVQDLASQLAEAARGEEPYTDASSTPVAADDADDDDDDYELLNQTDDDKNDYTSLSVCLMVDACPEPAQVSEVPVEEVGEEPLPQLPAPQAQAPPQQPQQQQQQQERRRPRPQTRQEHPSLCQAISSNPQKDFEAQFVVQQLSALDGWSSRHEEHKIIQLMRPHLNTNGYFVIWYWSLAKRPTVCVVQQGRVVTFVVHKSSTSPNKFYINRRQKRCDSLEGLLRFHRTSGIKYKPQGVEETTLWLSHPYRRQWSGQDNRPRQSAKQIV